MDKPDRAHEHPAGAAHPGASAKSRSMDAKSRSAPAKARSSARAARSRRPLGSGDGLDTVAWLDERQRREMIATAAFLRAQRRGFDRGTELEDWVAAEAEIDRWLQAVERSDAEPPLFEE